MLYLLQIIHSQELSNLEKNLLPCMGDASYINQWDYLLHSQIITLVVTVISVANLINNLH